MGTGGTLPTNITQTVTLYNTTGVIEKDKGIYFCPFLSTQIGTGHTVRQGWIDAFKQALNYQSNSAYSNINISQWNPKDRSLVIKGNSDDFRIVTEEGNCFNYLIVERSVTENSTTKTHYYAFFITDVAQVGQGSVRLELQPDDFTNVFYLHNTKERNSYSGNYVDVFNERLKNCYVARQHYNRVRKSTDSRNATDVTNQISSFNRDEYTIVKLAIPDITVESFPDLIIEDADAIPLYMGASLDMNYVTSELVIENGLYYVEFYYEQVTQAVLDHIEELDYTIDYYRDIYLEDNLPIFSQIEEGFKYKRQFRDYKEFINYGDPLTAEEKQAYEDAESWSDLTDTLKIKALKLSTAFVTIVFNTSKIFPDFKYPSFLPPVFVEPFNALPNTTVRSTLPSITLPILTKIDILSKFWTHIKNNILLNNNFIKFYSLIEGDVLFNDSHLASTGINIINDILKEGSIYATYVVTAFISKESFLQKYMTYRIDGIDIKVDTSISTLGNSDVPFFLLKKDLTESDVTNMVNHNIFYNYGNPQDPPYQKELTITTTSAEDKYYVVPFNTNNSLEFNINLTDKVDKDLKNEYFDTVLTFNPYSFYSISYLGRIEVPLNKTNYYENPIIKGILSVVISDIYKYSFIPVYNINGKEIKYYTESIEQSMSNSLTIITSELTSYLIANQTQMRNQYAVNDLNHEYGLITTAVSGVGNIAGGFGKGAILESAVSGLAGAGALVGAVQTATGLIGEAIDWDRDSKQIAMNQKAKLADMGNLPSNLKQVGTDINIDLSINELGLYLNHYTIDEVSYNSICKYLERFGYMVNIYDSLNVNTRKGWDYVQLVSFDYDDKITTEQEDSIRQILQNGVTLLHDHNVMVSGHNYEIILD